MTIAIGVSTIIAYLSSRTMSGGRRFTSRCLPMTNPVKVTQAGMTDYYALDGIVVNRLYLAEFAALIHAISSHIPRSFVLVSGCALGASHGRLCGDETTEFGGKCTTVCSPFPILAGAIESLA